ncbi:MAG: peptidylprolyl isomerase [Bacteroidales bacterium]|nr:peptidylprolyl isomerase [Bacteroidales bacterium]
MNKIFKMILVLPIFFFALYCNAPGGNENTIITIKTTLGDLKIMLYDGTPVHRDNFIKLINSGFYEGVSFHRVINSFMIQAGDPATRNVPIPSNADSLNTYSIPSEFNRSYFHKKGSLAAAREGNDVNPEMRSSGTQFYIVQGTKHNDDELNLAEQRINSNIKQAMFNKIVRQVADSARLSGKSLTDAEIQENASLKMFQYLSTNEDYKIPDDQRIVYRNSGGVPRLDGTYTVFGEVIEGLDVVDKIAAVKTYNTDKPLNDIKIIKIKIESK